MTTWGDLAKDRAEIAEGGRQLLYQHGVGLAFLATVGPTGRPRVHPMCPLLHGEGLFAFIIPSPKQRDLRRGGMYSMHSFPCPQNEDAFYMSGRAKLIGDPALRAALSEQFVSERQHFPVEAPGKEDDLFHFLLEACLLTRTAGHGDPSPRHEVWRPVSPAKR